MEAKTEKDESKGYSLYPYQKEAIEKLFNRLSKVEQNHNLLFQLPTGGGKTIIFSEIAKKYIQEKKKKVLILTHRIELSVQTSRALEATGVKNTIINSKSKSAEEHEGFDCFVAMVETLNNRLDEDDAYIDNIGLVIIDEAHYNSFRKLFKFFENVNMLGVTATPLSSNMNLPLYENYDELVTGASIASLIEDEYLSDASTFSYDVNLRTLKVGVSGDFTVASSDKLYGQFMMLEKLLNAYEEKCKGKKTLIFNSGIQTSLEVYKYFKEEGYDNIKHLDSTYSDTDRKEVLDWFHNTPNAVLTSVGILTTGFDEPTVESIILNRATRSLTLYHQMCGRGSRVYKDKKKFTIIDLGNNAQRFGLWQEGIDWHMVFKFPNRFLEGIFNREKELMMSQPYEMPDDVKDQFASYDHDDPFNMVEMHKYCIDNHLKPIQAIDFSIEDHLAMIVDNARDYWEGRDLQKLLADDIKHRIKQYSYCIAKSTDNYQQWLFETYNRKLQLELRKALPMGDDED